MNTAASTTNQDLFTGKPVKPMTSALSSAPETAGVGRPQAGSSRGTPAFSRTGIPREQGYKLGGKFLLGDSIVAFVAIVVGLLCREVQRLEDIRDLFRMNLDFFILSWSLGGSLIFVWSMLLLRSYDVENIYRMQMTVKNVVKSALLVAIAAWASIGLFDIGNFSPRVGAAYSVATLFIGIVGWRLLTFAYLINPKVKHAVCARTVVIGWTQQAAHLREVMKNDLGQLVELIGCVPLPGGRFAERPPADLAVLGDYSALPQIVADCRATSVILADVSCSSAEIQGLISYCQRELLKFQLVPQYFPALYSGLQVETVSGVPLLGVRRLPLDRTVNRVVKRGLDIAGGMIGMAVSAVVVPFFCALVYFESPGPVIFRQRRTSRAGRDFYIYKIRSMRLNAEGATGAVWCKEDDPRRLRIGTFMRKTNIDELPQFWNVLKGDMSLVGPRPERPELIEKFKYEIPNYNARHEVRAGLTGWAQINGLRGDTDLGKRIEADLYYLENWSILLDIYCIFATFVKRKNAY